MNIWKASLTTCLGCLYAELLRQVVAGWEGEGAVSLSQGPAVVEVKSEGHSGYCGLLAVQVGRPVEVDREPDGAWHVHG